ncbi:MAG: sensor histidine kinase [Panacagrimonas sp.]
MTIRRLLLVAFLAVGLIPATVLTGLSFNRTRAAMQAEIEQGVLRGAESVSAEVDKLLFERMLNATTWNHLEVMQDLRLHDVDKRLSVFLAEMHRRYGGVYLGLHAVDTAGHVVSSSSPAMLNTTLARSTAWLSAELPGGAVTVDAPQAVSGGQHRLRLWVGIDSNFTEGEIGALVLDVDGASLERVLDQSATHARQTLVLDQSGAVIVASAGLRAQGLAAGTVLADWAQSSGASLQIRDGQPLMASAAIVGRKVSTQIGPSTGTGLTTLLLQSRAVALEPVQRMAWVFAGLLAATVLATILIAFAVAGRIARPIVALTEFTRGYLRPGPPPAPPRGSGEVGELSRSFVRLVEDLQRSQQTLVQASKLAALGEVTALMAHEVRTPLGILRSSAQMLRSETQLSPDGKELLAIIESETARLNRLVSSMLDSARSRAPQLKPTDLHALIVHAVALLAAQARDRGVTVTLDLGASRFVCDADAEQFTQVMLNLMMNALQILPRGGQVRVGTRSDEGRLRIEVADNGPGIAADEREHLFEPFVFKREGGVGLGLAVVRQIVRAHGGEVAADASPTGGALFRVSLPLIPAQ